MPEKAVKDLISENQKLRVHIGELQETLDAIRRGEVDGLVVSTPKGEQVYSISGAEKPYRILIEKMKEGAVMLSDDNTILYCNSGFATMLKCSLEKIVGSNIENMVSPTYKIAFKDFLSRCRVDAKNGALTKTISFNACDHSIVPTQISANSLVIEKTVATFIVVTDLTQHMQEELKNYTGNLETLVQQRTEKLEQSNRKLSEILEGMQENFYILDRNWNFVYANKQITAAVGMEPQDWIGKNLWEIFPKYLGTEIEQNYRAAMEKKEVRRFESQSKYSGIWYLTTVYPSIEGISVVATNITERKKLEKQLQDKERLATIGATASMVGHDIRNPLQAITGDLYLASEELKDMPSSETKQAMKESFEAIEENIGYINKIVSDLQDYTRPLNPTLEKVYVKKLISENIAATNIPNNIKTHVDADENFVLDGDPDYLRRVLTNLIVNAVQAMPTGGELTIDSHQKSDVATISVKDTGVGIAEKVKPNLFTPLFTTKAKGQGLGLAVVKRLVDSMKGTITFESEAGKGTTFTITLPVNTAKTVQK